MSTIIDGSAGVTTNTGAVYNGIQAATAVASTSGTSIDFTSIPSWVKRITVMFSGVSLSGASDYVIRVGSGSVVTSGYTSNTYRINPTPAGTSLTSGFIFGGYIAATVSNGTYVLTLIDSATNKWVGSGQLLGTDVLASISTGIVALSGTLDRLRITTVSGTDTFDAGSINILYE